MLRSLSFALLLCAAPVVAQQPGALPTDTVKAKPVAPKKPWYETFSIRGYGQVRYNRLLETNDQLKCEQCDRSWGDNGGFFIRRARIIFSGYVHPRVYIYLQPDFASSAGTTQHVAQLRDWYVDLGLDPKNEFRVRLGQSKVPYSFENMQSSQNRLPLDRADPTNSANSNERDLGAFLYWAPARIRDRFKMLVDEGLKGSGDYGVVAFGVYNGQTANRPEANDVLHTVARITWPFALGEQILETSAAGYTGKYVVTSDQRSPGVKGSTDWNYMDERMVGSVNLYPRPFGLLAEYNVGRGPEYNPATDSIETKDLSGGFVTLSYRLKVKHHTFFPFARYQVYDGGKKHELDARSYTVNDFEAGIEWQPNKNFELVCEYYWGDRTFEDHIKPDNAQVGQLLRIQGQFNF
ncbi:MAG: porin [Flavobacteriales bacterium]|nr:porin [Flavobacteriales bacterium]MBL0035418.1 porin [Flavobacteriales bacterium]